MAGPIDKEKARKKTRQTYIIIGIVLYVYSFFAYFYACNLMKENRRLDLISALSDSLIDVLFQPWKAFPIQLNKLGGFIGISFMVIALVVMKAATNALRKHDNPDTVNGEAHLMNGNELKEYNKRFSAPFGKIENNGKENMILSKDIRLAINNRQTRRNCNILTIGGSGAGKSRFFVGPNLLQANSNYICTDPSGELLNDYGKYLENQGYDVLVFNLTDVKHSNHYNPFFYIREEKDVFTLVEAFIRNTTPEGKGGGDPFWESSEKLLLNALMLYLWHERPIEEQTFENVVKLVGKAEVDENDASSKSPLDYLFEALENKDPENIAVQQYKKFKLGAGKTLKSILISVGVRLQAFDLSDIKYLTNTDDFDLYSLGDTKKAIFVIIPTADKTFNFLAAMFYSQIFSVLYTYCEINSKFGWRLRCNGENLKVFQANNEKESLIAQKKALKLQADIKKGLTIKKDKKKNLYCVFTKSGELLTWRGSKEEAVKAIKQMANTEVSQYGKRLDNHVRLLLDEFANIGQIPAFNEKLATMRKYEISCAIILQALSQLKGLYKDDYNTIVANCDSVLFLGSADMETIEWVIKKLAKKTTTVENTSWNSNNTGGSTSYNKSSIELLTADQIQMMDDTEALVCIRGVRPYYGKKFDLLEHPKFKESDACAGKFYIPVDDTKVITNIPLHLRDKIVNPPIETSTKSESAVKPKKKAESIPKAKDVSLSMPATDTETVTKDSIITATSNVIFNKPAKNSSKPNTNTSESLSFEDEYPTIDFTEEEKERMSRENKERREKAGKNKKAIQDIDIKNSDVIDNFEADLLNTFGLDENSSLIQIKEAVETMVNLDFGSDDEIAFIST